MSERITNVWGEGAFFTPADTQSVYDWGVRDERERIIRLLTDLNAIRRDALGHLVAFNTDGTQVAYLEGLEN